MGLTVRRSEKSARKHASHSEEGSRCGAHSATPGRAGMYGVCSGAAGGRSCAGATTTRGHRWASHLEGQRPNGEGHEKGHVSQEVRSCDVQLAESQAQAHRLQLFLAK